MIPVFVLVIYFSSKICGGKALYIMGITVLET
jgi:hypothetical protein